MSLHVSPLTLKKGKKKFWDKSAIGTVTNEKISCKLDKIKICTGK